MAIIGENGAGKTTLPKVCAGLLAPDAGSVRRHGGIGYCPRELGVVELLTSEEHVLLFGAAAGLSRSHARTTGIALLDSFGFPTGENAVARDLSGGTRQKLNLVLGAQTGGPHARQLPPTGRDEIPAFLEACI